MRSSRLERAVEGQEALRNPAWKLSALGFERVTFIGVYSRSPGDSLRWTALARSSAVEAA